MGGRVCKHHEHSLYSSITPCIDFFSPIHRAHLFPFFFFFPPAPVAGVLAPFPAPDGSGAGVPPLSFLSSSPTLPISSSSMGVPTRPDDAADMSGIRARGLALAIWESSRRLRDSNRFRMMEENVLYFKH